MLNTPTMAIAALFDFIIEKHKLNDPALQTLAVIVRGADTDRHDLASQASGLLGNLRGPVFQLHQRSGVAAAWHDNL